MDDLRFDTLARELAAGVPRRRALGLVAALPFAAAGLSAFTSDDAEAKRKKKKRKKKKKPTPPSCTPETAAQTCAGRCGAVANNCGQTVQCAACGCPANQTRVNGVCTPCDVTCTGSAATCGAALADKLVDGGTLVLCPGVYGGSFTLDEHVELIGAGASSDPAKNAILDGQGSGRVVLVNAGITATLRNMRIRNGNAESDPPSPPGEDSGGGIRNNGTLNMSDCVVTGNTTGANGSGGGISNVSILTMIDTVVSGNTGGAYGGGGLDTVFPGQLTMTRCTITGNTANGGGGLVVNGPAYLNGCIVRDNTVGDGYQGGGIAYLSRGQLTLIDTQITNNRSGNGGGIDVACQDTTPLEAHITGGAVKNNTAVGDNLNISNCGTLVISGDPDIGTCGDVSGGSTDGCGCPGGDPCP